MKKPSNEPPAKGFALVVTLTLMILLTIVAVGLLTLSSVSLRAASRTEALAAARSNARMALMLAIGDLQKTTGPDRAITAPSSLIDRTNPFGVTGVWAPWEEGRPPESRTSSAREDRFQQWLLSTVDGTIPDQRTSPPLAPFGSANSVPLLGDGSLGKRKAIKGDDQGISLATTRVVNGKAISGIAWAVIDEGTKARADLYEKDPGERQAAVLRVGSPPVEGVRALGGLDSLRPDETDAARLVTMDSVALLPDIDQENLRIHNPDLTVHSSSLLTSVTSGGFKKDLSIWFSKGLTDTERTAGLYSESNLLSSPNPSDPALGLLEGYHNYYKHFGRRIGAAVPEPGGVAAKLPIGYTPLRNEIANPSTPTEPLMIPTVLRVDVIFSLIARDVHGNSSRIEKFRALGRPYMLHLLYLPVVTLHNPYNVPLAVEGMRITFRNVPIAFQFLVDGRPLTNSLVPLNQLYVGSENDPARTKDFSCTLSNSLGSASRSAMALDPGQTKLFGTPKVEPTWRWMDESPGAGADGVALFDWRNNQTAEFNLAPKLMTDAKTGAGFDIDWLAPRSLQTELGKTCGAGEGIVALKGRERIGANYAPFAPPAGDGRFSIKVELEQSGVFVSAGAFSIKYGNAARLKEIVEQGTSLRFPSPRSFPETFPKAPADKPFRVVDIYERSDRPIKDYITPKPFVIFSVGSRTTKESFLPNRTIADSNPVMNVANIDLSSDRRDPVGGVPLEMVMMPIRNGNAAIEDIRATEEGFAFGGNGSLHGSPRATFYELPRAPLQSLAQFRHANLAGSGFMPLVTYTVGESRAHPQIGTDAITNNWTDRSVMLDHTWLANEALWDRYFLSTIADQTTSLFATSRTYKDVMGDFFTRGARLPNQRFKPYNSDSSQVPAAVQQSAAPQDVIAASILLNGGFNVNSTSQDAWIAVLSALREADIETNGGMDLGSPARTAFPRVRRPTGKDIDRQPVNLAVSRWEGYRSLTDIEIASLAKEITSEVRKRGPFLSLADFVNRGMGSDEEEVNLKGAIQAAIDRVNINQKGGQDGFDLTAANLGAHGYKSLKAAIGNTASNAPAEITQGDILTGLGSRITVRSDTFRIRAYGEVRDATGKIILAKAWCEAIVQRLPEYVDPSDNPSVNQPPLTGAAPGSANAVFGRRYEVVNFRWLAPSEV